MSNRSRRKEESHTKQDVGEKKSGERSLGRCIGHWGNGVEGREEIKKKTNP